MRTMPIRKGPQECSGETTGNCTEIGAEQHTGSVCHGLLGSRKNTAVWAVWAVADDVRDSPGKAGRPGGPPHPLIWTQKSAPLKEAGKGVAGGWEGGLAGGALVIITRGKQLST